ncbi:MAG: Rpn family recombination-promoting nuclease/putative transposase [Lachnospira sp.]
MRIIDDTLFRLMAEQPDVCQEILRTLLDKPTLKVIKVTAQSTVQSMNREIILDALCETDEGLSNIEVQKGMCNDDVARTRFHASAITSKYTPKGTRFSDIPNVTIVYITEYDALHNNQTVTHVTRCMKTGENFIPLNDGEDIIFANTSVIDGTDKSELLQLMLHKEAFYNEKFPATSKAFKFFKETEGGQAIMCKTVEDYAEKRGMERFEKGLEEGLEKGRIKTIAEFLSNGGSEADAVKLLKASNEDLKEAKELLLPI